MRPALVAATLLALPLGACLGPAPWADWEQAPVAASPPPGASYDTRSDTTGAVSQTGSWNAPGTTWTAVETNGAAPLAPLETAPLAPPPGVDASPEDKRASDSGDQPTVSGPYQAQFSQHTVPLTVTGLGSGAIDGASPFKPRVQRTLPLIVAGGGAVQSQ